MLIQLTTTQWLQLPVPVRMKLKEIFAIPRSEGSIVQDNVQTSDGYNHRDLANITVEKMQAYTKTDEQDFYKLFETTLSLLTDEMVKETAIPFETSVPPGVQVQTTEELFITHNGKTYKLTEVPEGNLVSGATLYPTTTPAPTAAGSTPPGSPKKAAAKTAKKAK